MMLDMEELKSLLSANIIMMANFVVIGVRKRDVFGLVQTTLKLRYMAKVISVKGWVIFFLMKMCLAIIY
ncbi:hypothetical protein [Bartonella sp. DGB1]|uniref:hypothetical protein n=1 Tax=Bartonella sp. DGB1 TaxID=3239807 RepID=UPI00352526C8